MPRSDTSLSGHQLNRNRLEQVFEVSGGAVKFHTFHTVSHAFGEPIMMTHVAFKSHVIYENHPAKITSLACWGNELLVGTVKGNLLVYTVTSRDDTRKPYNISLRSHVKDFAKGEVKSLTVVQPENLLVSLYVCQVAPKLVKGAHMFAVDTDRRNGLRMVVGVKRKLIILEWNGTEFINTKKELSVPDLVRVAVWCGSSLCIGFKREYNLIDLATGAMSELFATGQSEPSAVVMPQNQILLGLNNISVFVGYDGKPRRKYGLTWTEVPKVIAQSHPYVIGLMPKMVEIQVVFGSLSQTLPLAGAEYLAVSADGVIYLASGLKDGTIWRLTPVPFAEQVEQLEKKQRYAEALTLCENLPNDQIPNRENRVAHYTLLQAYSNFNTGHYGKAMDSFFALKIHPFQVIALYPDMLPLVLRQQYPLPKDMNPLQGASLTKALVALTSYLEQKRKDLRLTDRLQEMSNKEAPSYGHSVGGAGDVDIGPFDQVEWSQTTALGQVLDTTLLKCYVLTNSPSLMSLLSLPNHCHVKDSSAFLFEQHKYEETVQLFKSRGQHENALILLDKFATQKPTPYAPSLSGIKRTVDYLKELGKTHLDVILKYSVRPLKTDWAKGIEIFTVVRRPADQLPPAVIMKHLEENVPSSELSPGKPNTGAMMRYLEFIINEMGNTTSEYHNMLIFYYFDLVLTLKRAADPSVQHMVAGSEPGHLGMVRHKLLCFLEDSKYYKPGVMLSRYNFADEGLHEERAILLSKIGQHQEALREYVIRLKDFTEAESYCAKHYSTDSEEGRNVYLNLLKIYLTEQAHASPIEAEEMQVAAARLLDNFYHKMDTVKAMDMLPEHTSIATLLPYFEKVLREVNRKRRMLQVLNNLQKSETMRVKAELMQLQTNVVRITEETTCVVCRKRLGDAIFARYPNGLIIHYLCYKQQPDKTIDPITGEKFGD